MSHNRWTRQNKAMKELHQINRLWFRARHKLTEDQAAEISAILDQVGMPLLELKNILDDAGRTDY